VACMAFSTLPLCQQYCSSSRRLERLLVLLESSSASSEFAQRRPALAASAANNSAFEVDASAPAPPIPELEKDYWPALRHSQPAQEAQGLGSLVGGVRDNEEAAMLVATMLQGWLVELQHEEAVCLLFEHYSVEKPGGFFLQVNQFYQLICDASITKSSVSKGDIVGTFCQCSEADGMSLVRFLMAVALLMALQHHSNDATEALEESQRVIRTRLVPYAKLVQREARGNAERYISPLLNKELEDALVDEQDKNAILKALERAHEKFTELSGEANGYLEGSQIVSLVTWIWGVFQPAGRSLNPTQKKAEARKLAGRHAGPGLQGQMHFREFEEYFITTAMQIARFRRLQQAHKHKS